MAELNSGVDAPGPARKGFLGWLFGHKILFGLVLLVGGVLTVGVLTWALVDVGGRMAYRKQVAAVIAEGGSLDPKVVIPKAGPPEQNMMATKLLAPLLSYERWQGGVQWQNPELHARMTSSAKFSVAPDGKEPTNGPGSWQMGRLTDLEAYQKYYHNTRRISSMEKGARPADDVWMALSEDVEDLQELRAAGRKPDGMFPIWEHASEGFNMLLPHLAVVKRLAGFNRLRAIAALEQGASAEAVEEQWIAFRLTKAICREPLLISQLVAAAALQIQAQSIWEGEVKHQWKTDELLAMQQWYEQLDFLSGLEQSYRGERAFCDTTIHEMANRTLNPKEWLTMLGGGTDNSDLRALGLIRAPKGFLYWNLASILWFYEDAIKLAAKSQKQGWCDRAAWTALDANWQSKLGGQNPTRILAKMLLPALSKTWVKMTHAEAVRRLIVTSCALERYRLENGSYPKELGGLTPKFLKAPLLDPFDGKGLRYSVSQDGQYWLYSVGRDGVDNGGTVVFNKSGRSLDQEQGDIVWPSVAGQFAK